MYMTKKPVGCFHIVANFYICEWKHKVVLGCNEKVEYKVGWRWAL